MAISRTLGGGLRGLRDRMVVMASADFRTRLAQLCGMAALKLVADEFNQSRDPDGESWEPLQVRKGKPLLDTGRLRASFSVQPADGFFRIGTAVSYAGFHQFGTRWRSRSIRDTQGRFRPGYRRPSGRRGGIPARPMLPTRGVPEAWTEAFGKEINRAVARQLRGTA